MPARCLSGCSKIAKSPKQIDPPRISSQIPGIAQTPPGFIRSADRSLSPPRRRNRRDPRDTDWSPPDADRLHPRPDDSQADARIRRLERRGGPEAVRPSVHGPDPSRTADPSRPFRSERHPAVQPAVDQDRRLSRGLRLLPAIRASRHRPGSRQADAAGRRDRRRARAGRRRAALLHGRRLAQPQAASPGSGGRDGQRGEGAGHGNLRDAGHAGRGPGRTAQARRAGLLQPQPGHFAGVLRQDHLHPHLPGPPGYAGARARRRHQCLLRRHRGHGRIAPRARRADRPARQHGALPRIRAD